MSVGTILCNFIGLELLLIYNSLLSSNSATFKQALHADLKLVLRAKTSWASDILRAFFEGLRGCDVYKQAFLQGLPVCYSDVTADSVGPEVKDEESVEGHY